MLRLLDVHNQTIQQAVAAIMAGHQDCWGCVSGRLPLRRPCRAVCPEVHTQFHSHNADKEPTEQIHVRIGIHSGDIVQRDGDVFGDGVNIAARLQALAEPDSICISDMVSREVAKKLDLGTVVSLGKPD